MKIVSIVLSSELSLQVFTNKEVSSISLLLKYRNNLEAKWINLPSK